MKCILIVDDSPVIRRNLRVLLEQGGWAVCGEAENGLDGIQKAQQLKPDLVVLDRTMPVMNGLQAARKLKKMMPAVSLLMYANHASTSLRAEAREAGIDTLRNKSGGIAALVMGIRQLLDAAA